MRKILSAALALSLAGLSACANKPQQSTCIDPAKVNPDAICTMQYEPVCGCDGQTYSNPCIAEKAGVTSYTQGACAGQE